MNYNKSQRYDFLNNLNSFPFFAVLLGLLLVVLYHKRTNCKNNTQPSEGKEHRNTDHYSLVDSNVIAQTVELLSESKDLDSSLQMILGVIGSYYQLSYVGIIESEEQTNQGLISHEWRWDPTIPWNSNLVIPETDMAAFASYNQNHNTHFATNDLSVLRQFSEPLSVFLSQYHVTGFFECGILNKNTSSSFIVCSFTTPDRVWAQHEIDTLLLLTKIISGYLQQVQIHKQAQWMKKVDPLTGCNNLTTFSEDSRRIVLTNPSNRYVIFYSDIDKFKLINENHGYSEGDRILIEFTNAMRSILEPEETFGRIGADKFVGLFHFDHPKQFLAKIKALNEYMNAIVSPNQSTYRISIIIGLCPLDHSNQLSLTIDQANIARKSITNRHKSRYAFFSELMRKQLLEQHEIEGLMEDSLEREDFKVYYQPKFDLTTGKISGAEALVRWNHPEKGMIYPNDFIPIFEENHFILKLDFYVFEQVCKHIQKLMQLGKEIYPVSVNFSRVHLDHPRMIEKLQMILDQYQVPPHYLEIELTESALQNNDTNMYSILIKLHRMGFRISMDDFGSGLSSLNLLRSLPCDIIKLDKDFFQQGTSTKRERIVIQMIVKMAKELHMTIVSEGVETEEQAEFLRSIQCDIAQGYLYARPMPEPDYEKQYYEL